MSCPWYFEVNKDSSKIKFLRDGAAPGDGKQFDAVKKATYNDKVHSVYYYFAFCMQIALEYIGKVNHHNFVWSKNSFCKN